jgi:hypothetical protein
MPDRSATRVARELAALTSKQKRFVRKLAGEKLKAEEPIIVVIPFAFIGLGAMVGILAGVAVGHFVGHGHTFLSIVICVLVGAGTGGGFGWRWFEQRCRSYFSEIIRDRQKQISQIG